MVIATPASVVTPPLSSGFLTRSATFGLTISCPAASRVELKDDKRCRFEDYSVDGKDSEPERGAIAVEGREGEQPLRIAILLNSYRSRFLPAIRASYERTIGRVSPEAQLVFYEPANHPGQFPDLDRDHFDLVVIGGSNVDPRKNHPWMLDVHAFVRRVVGVDGKTKTKRKRPKVLGICWGHQTIHRVFGGVVVDAEPPELGVAIVNLTENGQQFFTEGAASLGSFKLQQHHRREVATAAPVFIPLAWDNQCFLHENNMVLTFQGHPEKDAETARLRMHDSLRWFGFDAAIDEKAWRKLEERICMEHDGEMVWSRIFQWLREPPSREKGDIVDGRVGGGR